VKNLQWVIVVLVTAACAFAPTKMLALPYADAEKNRAAMIVSADWLGKHLADKNLVIIHIGDQAEYEAGHIPGAQYLALENISTPRGSGLTLELPAPDKLKAAFEQLGVSDNSRVILYFGKDWITPTARVFLTLDYLGMGARTSILDGGMPAWRAAGQPLTIEIREAARGTLPPRPQQKLLVDAAWVQANSRKSSVALLAARLPKFFDGTEAGNMPRAGHIPGAANLPFTSLINEADGKFKSTTALRELFERAGVETNNTVVSYCHIGQQASLLYFVARLLGYDAHLYDGSFQEWSARKDLPVEGKSEMSPPKQ